MQSKASKSALVLSRSAPYVPASLKIIGYKARLFHGTRLVRSVALKSTRTVTVAHLHPSWTYKVEITATDSKRHTSSWTKSLKSRPATPGA